MCLINVMYLINVYFDICDVLKAHQCSPRGNMPRSDFYIPLM